MTFLSRGLAKIASPYRQRTFKCAKCGSCCSGYGGIMIDAKAARDIAGHLGLTPTQVETFYLKYEGRGLYSVKNSPGNTGTCLFYSGQRCLVDPVKPPICRAWPFLYGTLNSREAFQDAKSTCAGLKDMSYEDFVEDFQSRGLAMPPRTFTSLIQQQSSARLVEAHRFR